MADLNAPQAPSRGHRKREKTRGQLLAAAQRVLAVKGEALTVSDVVAEADVSNGTFYNYFPDRDALFEALASHLVLGLAATAAAEPTDDPALRFAVASGRVLRRAVDDATWGRVVLRLINRPGVHDPVDRYLREDLAEGLARGRFEVGAEDAAIDQALGLLAMTIRRIVTGEAGPDAPARAVERGLRALGVSAEEARALTRAALEEARPMPGPSAEVDA